MNRKNTKESGENTMLGQSINSAGSYIKSRWKELILFVVTFLLTVFVSFLHTTSSNSVNSFNIDEYRVGQISDINIVANKDLPATDREPAVYKGELVAEKGFAITEEQLAKMNNMAHSKSYIDGRAFADSIVFLMLVSALYFFLYGKICLGKKAPFKELLLEAILFFLVYSIASIGATYGMFSSAFNLSAIIPGSFCVFLIAIMFGTLDAVYFSFIVSFGVLGATGFQLVTFLYVLTTCLISVAIIRKIEKRLDMVVAAVLQGLLNIVFIAVFKVIFNDPFRGSIFVFLGVGANGFLSGILALGFITPLEFLLNTASAFRLMDLSDQQSPEMKQMEIEARGTYEHSRMVGRLAEAACREIGANALLARVCGYYHDIGKMDHPEYFTENSLNGENIHRDLQLNPSLSISMIKSHVKKGVDKARELHLPKEVIDAISEHHGNQVIEYFYNEALKLDPNAKPEDYSYSGNIPSSRESAVLLLADTVEAACRSYCSGLEKPTAPQLEKFINGLINKKIDNHQLDDAGLTFADLTKIRDTFVHIMAGFYHTRIKYQNQKNPEDENAEEKTRLMEASLQQGGDQSSQPAASDVKESKDPTEIKEPKESKEVRETKDSKETKEKKDGSVKKTAKKTTGTEKKSSSQKKSKEGSKNGK